MRTLSAALTLALLLLAGHARADPDWISEELNPARLQARIAAVATDSVLGPAQREQAKSRLESALERLQQAAAFKAQAESLRTQAARSSAAIAELEAQAKRLAPSAPSPLLSLSELEQGLAKAEGQLVKAREEQSKLQQTLAQRGERKVSLERRAAELEGQPDPPRPSAPANSLLAAEALDAAASRRAQLAELDALKTELKHWDERKALLLAESELAARRLELGLLTQTAWQRATSRERLAEAERDAAEAERVRSEAIATFPPLRALGEEVRKLAEGRTGATGSVTRLEDLAKQLVAARAALQDLRRRRASVEAKVGAAGLTNTIGLLLRRELDALPAQRALRAQVAARQDELADLQYQLIVWGEEGQRSADERLKEVLQALGATRSSAAEASARQLVDRRAELLSALSEDYERTFQRLVDLDALTSALADEAEAYQIYIHERILWVGSVTGRTTWADLAEGARWAASPSAWGRGLRLSLVHLLDRWLESALSLLALLALIGLSLWTRGRIRGMADRVRQDPQGTVGLTFQASGMVVARALVWPALLFGIGRVLLGPLNQEPQLVACARGLSAASFSLFGYELLRQVLHEDGLAERHLLWPTEVCAFLKRHLRWFIPIKVVVVLVVVAFDEQHVSDLWNEALGRSVFVAGALAQALFLGLVLRPAGPAFAALVSDDAPWVGRLRYPFYFLAVAGALLLALTAMRGFYYTSLQLEGRLHAWLWLLLGAALLEALGQRWTRALGEREGQGAAAPTPTEPQGEQTREAALRTRELVGIDLEAEEKREGKALAVEPQTQSAIRAALFLTALIGSYAIWSDVLPALKRLERVEVYPSFRVRPDLDEARPRVEPPAVASKATPTPLTPATKPLPLDPRPSEETVTLEVRSHVVTLAALLFAMGLLAFTYLAVRNVPALLEGLLLKRLPMDAGSRYAAVTLSRYCLILSGGWLVAGRLGVGWDSVQWLAAALTFGLAFGLQEIFANFVSGLIILFERPVRVGDVVTVKGTSGVVTRIRMRATTITDFDRRELIVPNKLFVTGEVLNWVLTDAVVRVVIPVGVGYSADVEVARKIMIKVARRHRLALTEPAPACQLLGMGPSTYEFEVWVFVARAEDMNTVRHEVTRDLFSALTRGGIELPFPQQDVHVREWPAALSAPPPASPSAPKPPPAGGAVSPKDEDPLPGEE